MGGSPEVEVGSAAAGVASAGAEHAEAPADPGVWDRVVAHLSALGVPFAVSHHAPATTAQGAAEARGTDLRDGGKTLLVKVGKGAAGHFGLFTLCAADALHRGRLRKYFGTDRVRFASREELLALTGLTPGSVPPFGAPIFELPLYVDAGYAARAEAPPGAGPQAAARVVFTAGRHDRSLTLTVADHLRAAAPVAIYAFAADGPG